MSRRSLLGSATSNLWLTQFGTFTPQGNVLEAVWGSAVANRFHAEAHHGRILGADFTYSATITADWRQSGLSAHLQFRISDEGRYGVRVGGGQVAFYRLALEDRACADDPKILTHCPLWPADPHTDDPVETPLGGIGSFDPGLPAITLTIVAQGTAFFVLFGTPTQQLGELPIQDGRLGIGRFGLYAIADTQSLQVKFTDVAATTETTLQSNFALLYRTAGYDLDGTKRALVRTINDVDPNDINEAGSSFTVTNSAGVIKVDGRPFESFVGTPALRRTLGFQFLAADFSDVREPGRYTLEARLATPNGVRLLTSLPFEIAPRLVTGRMLWGLSILNAKARRAADDGFRRGWFIESGAAAWSVGLDGAFIADRADDGAGAALVRGRNIFNRLFSDPDISVTDFRMVARVTVVSGCDAQLQFRITGDERWAATLQAGDAGGCAHGHGPGAVRLHREGPAVPRDDHFEILTSYPLDGNPFQIGRAYDVEVRTLGQHIEVMLDGNRVIDYETSENPRAGTFALKAWGSTVRFSHMKVWARHVGLSRPVPGVWIPYNRATGKSSQGFAITKVDFENNGVPPDSDWDLDYPLAAQYHGFHDCNSFIGEITSHAVFLAALMEVWTTRASAASEQQQEDLRRAIVTAMLYLNELYDQGNRSGAFAHQEPGRAALALSNAALTTQFALYGLSAFAEKGSAVDRELASKAFVRATEAWQWLDENNAHDLFIDSVAAVHLARAADRLGVSAAPWWELARTSCAGVLALFATPARIADKFRITVRSIPWFEGLYEAFVRGPLALTAGQRGQVADIAGQLIALVDDPANGFCLMPQADDANNPPNLSLPARNWFEIDQLPLVNRPIPLPAPDPPTYPVGDWYISPHFAAAAADAVYIGRLANDGTLERLATGNVSWMLGLNPGVPTTKVVAPDFVFGPWSAASFAFSGPGAFARTIEGDRTQTRNGKGWLANWEGSAASRHREMWAFDPGNTGFMSIVNGHITRESQWHYWSIGRPGWVCGETFMLIDGVFLKAALALEDWLAQSTLVLDSPYDVNRFRFFDTTHFDRAATLWRFDDPEITPAAQAWRMATDFAGGKGFAGGRPTGHRLGELIGVVCAPVSGTTFVDVPLSEIGRTMFPFKDINADQWAQVGRAAMEIAARNGKAAGFFTGHMLSERCGWVGLDARLIAVFDVDDETVKKSQWAFDDINTVPWAQAARLATDVCIDKGFAGGFFSGHQGPGGRQIVAFRFV